MHNVFSPVSPLGTLAIMTLLFVAKWKFVSNLTKSILIVSSFYPSNLINQAYLRYVCVQYCNTVSTDYAWYNICSAWFLDIRISTIVVLENIATETCLWLLTVSRGGSRL